MPEITRQCQLTGKPFLITERDQAFYEKMEVNLPTLCPEERMRRRLAFRNERRLYHRKCALTGRQMISSASPSKPYPVYSIDAWWSDDWNPMDYGRDFDFSRPFFEQFAELKAAVPRLTLQQQKPMENSDYCNCASRNKNCYLVFSTNHCEDCYYGSWVNFSRDCVDNENSLSNELCYETVDCRSCYNVIFGEESFNCTDSAFIKNCIGGRHLLFCTNLRNKAYHIFNKPVSKEEFARYRKKLALETHAGMEAAKVAFEQLKKESFVKHYFGTQNENVSGNYISKSKNCSRVFECLDCEDVHYGNNLEISVKDCMDYSYWGTHATRVYESQACGYDLFNIRFCNLCWSGCSNLTYCDHCFASQDCFGCVGLKRARFCIFNKQYTEEEYHELMSKIIEHMKRTGEWGEFFPIESSSFAYNETLAQEWFPLKKQEALARGYHWEEDNRVDNYQGAPVDVADSILEVNDDITRHILRCESSGKLYKIIPQELAFYRRMELPIPRKCPDQRHFDRMARRNPRQLWTRNCEACKRELESSYSPDRPETLYCEPCYLSTVN